ncbi:hypothetical protein II906_04565 [bacterium]|nr:hypothetical protein [bacterium]
MAIDSINSIFGGYGNNQVWRNQQAIQQKPNSEETTQIERRRQQEVPSNPFTAETNAYASNPFLVSKLDAMDKKDILFHPQTQTREEGRNLCCYA